MAVIFQVEVFWVVTPCSIMVGCWCFRVPCSTTFYGVRTQKALTWNQP